MIKVTKIYLVTNCYGDPNKVYIGKTISSRKSNHKKTYGNQIEYNVIDEISSLNRKDWEPLESYWIEQFRQWGFNIVNINKKGGGGPEFVSDEIKNKISNKHRGMKKPWITTSRKNIPSSNKQKEIVSILFKGKPKTDDVKQKISKSNSKSKPQGFGEKISKSLTGYKRTEQNKINSSNALKGRKHNDETKQKMSLNSKDKNNKSVIQYDKQMNIINEFKSLTHACVYIDKIGRMGDITACCKGKQKTAFGFIWKYKK